MLDTTLVSSQQTKTTGNPHLHAWLIFGCGLWYAMIATCGIKSSTPLTFPVLYCRARRYDSAADWLSAWKGQNTAAVATGTPKRHETRGQLCRGNFQNYSTFWPTRPRPRCERGKHVRCWYKSLTCEGLCLLCCFVNRVWTVSATWLLGLRLSSVLLSDQLTAEFGTDPDWSHSECIVSVHVLS